MVVESLKSKCFSVPQNPRPNIATDIFSRRSEGGIAPVSGTGDRGFESRRFDQKIRLSLKGSLIFNFRDSNLKVLRRLASIVVSRADSPLLILLVLLGRVTKNS